MIHWRTPLSLISAELYQVKKSGRDNVSIEDMERAIIKLETHFQIEHDLDCKNIYENTYIQNLEQYAKLVKQENDLHRQYTQLVITAGYAAFFGIWSLVKEKSEVFDVSLILVIISVIAFVMLEVANVGLYGYEIHTKNKALLKAKAEDDFLIKQNEASKANNFDTYRVLWLSRFWIWTYPISVVTGVTGLFLMLVSLIKSLSIFN